jgi:hypothetical protein
MEKGPTMEKSLPEPALPRSFVKKAGNYLMIRRLYDINISLEKKGGSALWRRTRKKRI